MKMFVKPKEGIKIRRPDTGVHLDADGEFVPKNTFWARRVLDGDVIESDGPAESKDSGDHKEGKHHKKGVLSSILGGGDQ